MNAFVFCVVSKYNDYSERSISGGRTYLVGEGVILVGDQQDGGKKTSNFHTGKCILCYYRCFIEMCALIP